ncbi:hypothetical protein B1757_03850 [Acidithiobacillus marinus]|uniref:Uncharacterized protein n=1 Tax=Acidithiobacillus marinus TaxID=187490 RepID=A0A2I1DNU6_9PROT|nr:hypothetical protein [Acidithiobacillus marinus]PKY11548.1 hypothetical protein B1757_03850 [Acidithiobacillus marinus]
MSAAADLLDTAQKSGATIWVEGGRLKFSGLPAGLIPRIREHKAELLALLSTSAPAPAFTPQPSDQCPDEYTPAPTMQQAARKQPQRVTCSACARFQAGAQPLAVGRCLASADGLPPSPKQGDYKAAFPMAQRHCHEFTGVSS